MKKPVSFSTQDKERTSLNFDQLKAEGIAHVQALSGDIWTDYNSHDPGVTILEQLCYALTDVSLRATTDIKDLLTKRDDNNKPSIDFNKNSFYHPSTICGTHPVTLLDSKKMLIDAFDAIENVWITPMNNSGFEEKIVLTQSIQIQPKVVFNKTLKKDLKNDKEFEHAIKDFITSHRNLGEDVAQLCVLKPKKTNIVFTIHLTAHTAMESTVAHVFMLLFQYVYNPVRQYTLNEMLADGYEISDIFSGPKLTKGFIKDEDLKARVVKIEKLQLQQILSKAANVLKCEVQNLYFEDQSLPKNDSLKISESAYFQLLDGSDNDFVKVNSFSNLFENVTVKVNDKEVKLTSFNKSKIEQLLQEFWAKEYRQYATKFDEENEYNEQVKGTYRTMDTYYSIQNQFPLLYGIGEAGLSNSDTPQRHAQAKQLKAYLLFFEQHLANYLSQINHIDDFFANDFDAHAKKTYFTQPLSNIPGIEPIAPDPYFATDACVYYANGAQHRTYIEAAIDSKQLGALPPEKHPILLKRLLIENVLFKKYVKTTAVNTFPDELRFGSLEVQNYLETLYHLKFKWLEDHTEVDFGRAVIISFAMLSKLENKQFTPVLFATSFKHHLTKMLTAIGKVSILENLFDELKKVKATKQKNTSDKSLKGFIALYDTAITAAKEPTFFDRKSRMFDHLLARFGEDFSPTPWEASKRFDLIKNEEDFRNEILTKKSRFLNEIGTVSGQALKGEVFLPTSIAHRNPSGLELMLQSKTGILPRKTIEDDSNQQAQTNDETFYVVDHILLRDFLNQEEVSYGFKFVGPLNQYICGTVDAISWAASQHAREDNLNAFYSSFIKGNLFDNNKIGHPLKSNKIYSEDGKDIVATFAADHPTKDEVLALIQLFVDLTSKQDNMLKKDNFRASTGSTRLREVEKIRAKGLLAIEELPDQDGIIKPRKLERGDFGQRRLVYQQKLKNIPEQGSNTVVDEDFFNLSISVVLPSEQQRFKDQQFSYYIQELIAERVPAHIKVNILWLNQEKMDVFKTKYQRWERLKATNNDANQEELKGASFEVYQQIKNSY